MPEITRTALETLISISTETEEQVLPSLIDAHKGIEDISELAKSISVALTQFNEIMNTISLDQETNQALNEFADIMEQLQLKLQRRIQIQNRAFQLLTNIMKSKHDTLREIIKNIR